MRHERPAPRRSRARASVLVVAVALAGLPTAASAQSVPTVATDGRSPATAAASCWEIKQVSPSAPSGVYWLRTPELVAPQQFYCDQTTDGGGWVLIGRGREGWQTRYEGVGDPAQVHTPHTGQAAFQVRQLSSRTIDALMNGGRVDALQDRIRLRRATNANGTSWQEARFQLPGRDRWVWTFAAGHRVGSYTIDGRNGSGGSSVSFGLDNSYRRIQTDKTRENGWLHGFAFGSNVRGSNTASTHLWSNSSSAAARPFTQMFIRPRLRTADLDHPAIPDTGAPATTQTWLPENRALPSTWGVTGLANGRSGEQNEEVQVITQVGDRIFVGGNFRYVQQGSNGTPQNQSYLAAFDVNTGAWIDTFRPTFNQHIKALAPLPGDRIAVGGEFTEVNGQVQNALVILDAETGETDTDAPIDVQKNMAPGILGVRGLSVQGDWLYLGGTFSHLLGGSSPHAHYLLNVARVSVHDATPDASWNPLVNGTVAAIDASERGDRLYAAGYFTKVQEQDANRSAAIVTDTRAEPIPWVTNYSAGNDPTRANYQQAILEVEDRVFLAGAEHSIFTYERDDLDRINGSITNAGGDFQTLTSHEGVVFGGCHCDDWNYQGAYTWPNPGTNWVQADKIGWLGAYDAVTGDFLPEFNPAMRARGGLGAWASFVDSTGTLWIGGDFTSALRAGEINQWVGGFVRFASRDTTAPTTPGNTSITTVGGVPTATWSPATDDGGPVSYEVLREDRVVATTTSTSVELPDATESVRYFVRAVDAAGNRSASSTRLAAPAPGDPSLPHIDTGATWRWRFQQGTVPDGWREPGFDAGSWSVGAAPLGFGSTTVATNIDVAGGTANRPLSALFRRDFQVDDPATVGTMTITTYADDGVVVYVNGTEVGRTNLPSGTLTLDSYATAAPRTAAAQGALVTYTVPRGLLRAGTNTVAAQAHLNYRSAPDLSFDLSAAATAVDPDAEPPVAPTVTARADGPDAVTLSWPHDVPSDVVGYQVARDGRPLSYVTAPASTYTDEGLSPATTYSYSVTAVSSSGVSSLPGTASVTTPQAPGAPLLDEGSSWRWRFEQGVVSDGWREPGFDAGSWSLGAAPLGFGSTTIATNLDVSGGTGNRPLSALFRRDVEIDELDDVAALTLTTYADDGVAVFVNGTEVGRTNLPSGDLTLSSYATAAPRTAAARGNPISFTVPRGLLREGTNTIAAQSHLNYRSSPDLSFDLRAEVTEVDPDSVPPATPTSLTATVEGPDAVSLSWTQPSGPEVAGYRITRNGDQAAYVTAPATVYRDAGLDPGTSYAYAVAAIGTNGAASSEVTVSASTEELDGEPLVVAGSQWRWRYGRDVEPPADWREPGFDAETWTLNAAPLGFGASGLTTDIDVTGGTTNRPLSALFRHDVMIDDPDEVTAVEFTTYADDGVVVFLNGHEVQRVNMPEGAVHLGSYATAAPRTAAARAEPVTFTVPGALLRAGVNTIAVQTHLNYRSSPDLSFDLTATAISPKADGDAPVRPTLVAEVTGPTSVELSWDQADGEVAGYRLTRDGTQVAYVPAPGTGYLDSDLTPGTSHTYELVTVGSTGLTSPPDTVTVRTHAAALLAEGSTWSWRFEQGGAVPDDWQEPGGNVAGWSTGPAPLGFGSSAVVTNIDVAGGSANRPLSALFRRDIELAEPIALTLSTWADDGIVVFVNGDEIGRRNLPSGPITFATYATAAPRTPAAIVDRVTWTVPASLLRAGTNTVSAQVHVNYRSTPDLTFDLAAVPADG